MTAPEFSFIRGIGQADWPAPISLSLEFDFIRGDRRSGDVSAEVTASSTANGSAGHLLHGRITLNSPQSKSVYGNRLRERLREPSVDVPSLLETACLLTLKAQRSGEPPILLREAERPEADGDLLRPGLLKARHPTMWFGDGGVGKSLLALAAGLSIHTGLPLLGGLAPTGRRRVALVDWEMDGWDHRDRMRQLLGDADLPDLLYVRAVGPLRDQVDRLRRAFRDHRTEFAVFDSVGMACEGPPEEAQAALGFWDALRGLDVGALCIAHVNRGGDTERPFGSAYWHNGARATWYIKRQQEAASSSLNVGFYNRKHNSGSLARPVSFSLRFADDRVQVASGNIHDVPELAGGVPLKDRMLNAVLSGPMTYEELADVLESNAESISVIARRYEGRLFRLLPGIDGRKRVAAAAEANTVRADEANTVRPGSLGGRTLPRDPPKGVPGLFVPPPREKEKTEKGRTLEESPNGSRPTVDVGADVDDDYLSTLTETRP